MVSELFGLPLANASLYDGASAAAEGVLMAQRLTGRGKVLACGSVHPHYRQTIHSYLSGSPDESVIEVPVGSNGGVDVSALVARIDESTAAVIVGYPSYLGPLSDLRALSQACAAKGALLIACVAEPYALALRIPGRIGRGHRRWGRPAPGLLAAIRRTGRGPLRL